MRKMFGISNVPWVLVAAMTACDAGGGASTPATTGATLTMAELENQLATGPTRVELKLDGGGVSELHVEGGDGEDRVQGWVASFDAATGAVTLDDLGVTITTSAATRFRTQRESHASQAAFNAALSSALSGAAPVFVRASRPIASPPQAPNDATFVATDLRLEQDGDPKIEIDVDGDNLGAAPPSLTVLGQTFDLGATELWDDSGHDGDDDLRDDHGNDGPEAGDDH